MLRTAWIGAVLLSFAAVAQRPLPGVSARMHAPVRVLEAALTSMPEEHTCLAAVAPEAWRDPSSARFFATGPTARLDAQELWAGGLVGLIDVRFARNMLRLFVLGSPLRAGLQFTPAGWRPRWPFC
jgi:hypothetical protein